MKMSKLSDIKIGKQLALAFGVGVVLLACVAGLSIWALNSASIAGTKSKQYAHKLNLAVQLDATLSALALRMTNLVTTRNVTQCVEQVLALRKQYATDLEYLKTNATTDEDRGMLRIIQEVVVSWRDLNNRIMHSVQAGKQVDAARAVSG
jgi:CHASE3 domain sensor protein